MNFFSGKYVSANDFFDWPAYPDTKSLLTHSILKTCIKTQWLSPEEIHEGQIRQVEQLLLNARTQSPYYRRMFANLDISNTKDFNDIWNLIPSINADTFANKPNSFIARIYPNQHGDRMNSRLYTPGYPLIPFQMSSLSLSFQNAFFARIIHDYDWDTNNALIDLYPGDGIQFKKDTNSWAGAIKTGDHFIGSMSENQTILPEWFNEVTGNYYIRTHARYLPFLIDQTQNGSLPELKGVIAYIGNKSEHELCVEARSNNIPVASVLTYPGFGMIATECPEEEKFHIQSETLLVEEIDNQQLITHVNNFATPLVRLNTNYPFKIEGSCPCGRGTPTITLVAD